MTDLVVDDRHDRESHDVQELQSEGHWIVKNIIGWKIFYGRHETGTEKMIGKWDVWVRNESKKLVEADSDCI